MHIRTSTLTILRFLSLFIVLSMIAFGTGTFTLAEVEEEPPLPSADEVVENR